jgi:hypothetical protein
MESMAGIVSDPLTKPAVAPVVAKGAPGASHDDAGTLGPELLSLARLPNIMGLDSNSYSANAVQ